MNKFDKKVKDALIELNLWNENIKEDEELWYFEKEGRDYCYVLRDNGKEIDSFTLLSFTIPFPDDAIPTIYFAAADVNNHHSVARICLHSHLFEGKGKMDNNLMGLQFDVPKALISDVKEAIEIGIKKLDDLYAEWDRVLSELFGGENNDE